MLGGDDEDEDEDREEEMINQREDIEYVDEEEVMMLVDDIAEGMLKLRPVPAAVALSSSSVTVTPAAGSGSDTVWGEGSSEINTNTSTRPVTIGFDTLVMEDKLRRRARVLTRRELILLLSELPSRLHLTAQERHQGRICVGMLGYPNVGKSSAINTILAVSKSSHGELLYISSISSISSNVRFIVSMKTLNK